MATQEFLARMRELDWQHSIDLGDRIITPGRWGEANPAIRAALNDCHLDGARVLDVGTLDGLYAFECEKQGAEVFATEWVAPGWGPRKTFLFAHAALKSKVRYFPDLSVYNIESLQVRDFDVVLFCGVYYHLRDPLLAFARLRKVMKTGAILIVEGAVLDDPGCFARYYYRESLANDRSNWWVPTVRCLCEWVESSFYDIGRVFPPPRPRYPRLAEFQRRARRAIGGQPLERHARLTLSARAVMRADSNYAYPYEELQEFLGYGEDVWTSLTREEVGNRKQ